MVKNYKDTDKDEEISKLKYKNEMKVNMAIGVFKNTTIYILLEGK